MSYFLSLLLMLRCFLNFDRWHVDEGDANRGHNHLFSFRELIAYRIASSSTLMLISLIVLNLMQERHAKLKINGFPMP